MQKLFTSLKGKLKRKATTIVLFSYGILIGTGAPVLLSRCTSSGANCSACAGFCGVALGILPLVLFFTMRGKITRLGRRLFGSFRNQEGRWDKSAKTP